MIVLGITYARKYIARNKTRIKPRINNVYSLIFKVCANLVTSLRCIITPITLQINQIAVINIPEATNISS